MARATRTTKRLAKGCRSGGRLARVTVRLSNGRTVTFYELSLGGRVTVCDCPAEAFEIVRRGRR
jgi:hypothetical protein